MRLTEARQGVRMLKFMDVFGCWEAASLTQFEAAELLGWASGASAVGAGAAKVRPACWIAGSARHRAGGCGWTGARRSSICIGRAIRASPRGISTSTWFGATGSLGVQLDEGVPAKPEPAAEGGASRGAPSQAAASSVAWDDGRVTTCVAGGRAFAGSGGDDGRRDERDLLGVSGRGRRLGFDVPGVVGSIRAAGPAAEPVYRSRTSLLSHGRSWRQGGSRPVDTGRVGVGASGSRAYRGLFTPGAWPVEAFVPDPCLGSCRIACQRSWRWLVSRRWKRPTPGKVDRIRETTTKTTTETAYYLLSSALSPERCNEVVRFHWGVENRLHWRLDITMNEDQDRTRLDNGPHNLAVLRHMALNIMQKDTFKKHLCVASSCAQAGMTVTSPGSWHNSEMRLPCRITAPAAESCQFLDSLVAFLPGSRFFSADSVVLAQALTMMNSKLTDLSPFSVEGEWRGDDPFS